MPIKCMNPKGDRSRAANWMTLEEPKARLSVLITVLLALAAALFPQADGHVAQAQSTTPTQVQMVYSLFEVDPLEFEEDVGTVRVGILAETNETGAPTTASNVTLNAKFDTAGSEAECLPPDDYRPISEVLLFRSTDFEAFTNDDGETRYRQSLYRDVWIFDDRVLEEDESFQLTLEPFHQAVSNPPSVVDELELTIIDNDGFVGVAFESSNYGNRGDRVDLPVGTRLAALGECDGGDRRSAERRGNSRARGSDLHPHGLVCAPDCDRGR